MVQQLMELLRVPTKGQPREPLRFMDLFIYLFLKSVPVFCFYKLVILCFKLAQWGVVS